MWFFICLYIKLFEFIYAYECLMLNTLENQKGKEDITPLLHKRWGAIKSRLTIARDKRLARMGVSTTYYPTRTNWLVVLLSSMTVTSDNIDLARRGKYLGGVTIDSPGKTLYNLFHNKPVEEFIYINDGFKTSDDVVDIIYTDFTDVEPVFPNGRLNGYKDNTAIYSLNTNVLIKKYTKYLQKQQELDSPKDIRAFVYSEIMIPLFNKMYDQAIMNRYIGFVVEKQDRYNAENESIRVDFNTVIDLYIITNHKEHIKKLARSSLRTLRYIPEFEASIFDTVSIPTLPQLPHLLWLRVLPYITMYHYIKKISETNTVKNMRSENLRLKILLRIIDKEYLYAKIPSTLLSTKIKNTVKETRKGL